jgi:preprotein translocase subunit SecF
MSGLLHRLYQGETDIDFIGRRRLWFAISGVLVLVCLVALVTRQLNFGIEFEGGVQVLADVVADGPLGDANETEVISEVRSQLDQVGAQEAQVQVITDDDGRRVSVQTKELSDPADQQALIGVVADATGASVEQTDFRQIGSKWGAEITDKAVRALVVFMLVILAFMAWRFEWKMAVGAIIALVHDLIITAGIYAIVGFEVTPSSVIAILTILGYSLYDTVVVFDKVEENTEQLAATGRMTYERSANLALNQVFMRSLNTSLATILPVGALLFVGAGLLGAETLKDLSLALLVGLLVGAYSSVFVATPVLSLWKEREPKYRSVRERLERDERRALDRGPAAVAELTDRVPAAVSAGPAYGPRSPARPRAGTKKAKRRKRR